MTTENKLPTVRAGDKVKVTTVRYGIVTEEGQLNDRSFEYECEKSGESWAIEGGETVEVISPAVAQNGDVALAFGTELRYAISGLWVDANGE